MKRLAQQESQIQPTEEKSSNPEIRTSPNFGLPKVFIDGYSLVKVALVDNFVNCSQYVSRSGMTFEGCLEGNLNPVKGIYYIPIRSLFSLSSRRKIATWEGIKKLVESQLQSIYYLKSYHDLLIRYSDYSIRIYDKFIKGRVLKFPLEGEQGHLYVSWVPFNLPSQLEYQKTAELQIYNHKIEFAKEVVKFDIHMFGGEAKLIYNSSDDAILVTLSSLDHGEKTVMLKANQLYLFTHARPRTGGLD